ncbi:FFLEELY motif protein [Polaromonas sp. UC242_47]|uniref:FFLEELY motif protein n=1 Tax=Polaromonas sp. UC242_47 TaxID=3374626 RepID=UPI003794F9D6
MDPVALRIREAMQAVSALRERRAADPRLDQACLEVKRFQAQRFKATYADLLHSPRYQRAAHFFLHELYGDQDYAQRDQQFARIASTIARLFPAAVVETAASLAEVHALTEQLDDLMAQQWLITRAPTSLSARYLQCWRQVADRPARYQQLQVVLHLGRELDRLTRMRGLRSLLKLMRAPAAAASLSSLQNFLEAGFDAFADMKGASEFLRLIEDRESAWIDALFEKDAVACETQLHQLLAADPAY